MTEEQKQKKREQLRAYRARPEVKERQRAWQREYMKKRYDDPVEYQKMQMRKYCRYHNIPEMDLETWIAGAEARKHRGKTAKLDSETKEAHKRESRKKYLEAHREEIRQKRREAYIRSKEAAREKNAKYKASHRQQINEYNRQYRERTRVYRDPTTEKPNPDEHELRCMRSYCNYHKIPIFDNFEQYREYRAEHDKIDYEARKKRQQLQRAEKAKSRQRLNLTLPKKSQNSCWSCFWARLPWFYREYAAKHHLKRKIEEWQCFCVAPGSERSYTIVEASDPACSEHTYRNSYMGNMKNRRYIIAIQEEINASVQAGGQKRIYPEIALKQVRCREPEI